MSAPQHIGDLIFPCPFGHFAISTCDPSGRESSSCTSAAPQWPQVIVPTLMPHFLQVYIAMALPRVEDIFFRSVSRTFGF